MSLTINHNISALNTQRNLEQSNRSLAKSLQKLSSGYKINVAADDPSGLIISEQLRSQTEGLQRAIRNSQEASNVIGIAEGALIEMNEILRSLRQLAVHAANNGVTAPEQIRADQAEVDSSIQTLNRIASTTKYADQFLLNGSKGIVFERTTVVDDTMDHELLNISQTRLDQIFKREDVSMTVTFNGIDTTTQPDYTQEARRAYFETDDSMALADIDQDKLTERQRFILTGTRGSRVFNFGRDTDLGSIVNAIDNVRDSTGVGAQLIFSQDVAPVSAVGNTDLTASFDRAVGDVEVYNANWNSANPKISQVTLDTNANIDQRLMSGRNLDGHGRVYAKVVDLNDAGGGLGNATLYLYKDAACTVRVGVAECATAAGPVTTRNFTAAEGSGLLDDDILMTVDYSQAALDDVYTMSFAGLEMNTGAAEDGMDVTNLNFNNLEVSNGDSLISGVELGRNTDMNGHLYFEATGDSDNRTINVYKDSDMDLEDLVATGTADLSAAATGRLSGRLKETEMEDGAMSGINATLSFTGNLGAAGTPLGDEIGSIQFDKQGIRLYSTEYGSEEYLRVQNQEGSLWSYYRTPDDANYSMIDEGATIQQTGADAVVSINGSPLSTTGLVGNISTQDYSGKLQFQEGALGETRIAAAGYDVGGIYSRAGAMQAVTDAATPSLTNTYTYATNARHVTTEILGEFIGGMQYQLAETDGDQSRTVYGIPSMAVANLGRFEFEGTTYTLQDVMGGGDASLARDPIMSMRVVNQAIEDVSSLRARLGAFQKNMLQTNINSLNVAVENITHTESAIRDANMAVETSEFTKNQILVQAGTAMLAQANTVSQNVLQLLG